MLCSWIEIWGNIYLQIKEKMLLSYRPVENTVPFQFIFFYMLLRTIKWNDVALANTAFREIVKNLFYKNVFSSLLEAPEKDNYERYLRKQPN
jgi:hypothetical protein